MPKVEWFGGPQDGAVFQVPDDCRVIRVAIARQSQFQFYDFEKTETQMETVGLPIMIRSDGSLVVCYPKGKS